MKELIVHVPHAPVPLFVPYTSCTVSLTGYASTVYFIGNSTECKLNLSDTLQSLVGQQNARHGIIKIFNALQETRANKHLLYVSNLKPTRGPAINSISHFRSQMGVHFNPLCT